MAMSETGRRPFYTDYAWAFDLLIDRPVRKECGTIVRWLIERGVLPGSTILDAGCGTGRYAIELNRRGYAVRGVDSSPELIDVAKRSALATETTATFTVGDISALPPTGCDAILCRGVLNDVVDDEARRSVIAGFARALWAGGVLILDVREWQATVERKRREPLFRKRVDTDRGTLTFTSVTDLDPKNRQLIVSENHTLSDGREERSSDFVFLMRCWTRDELESMLRSTGFDSIHYFGAYDSDVPVGSTDRMVVIAQI